MANNEIASFYSDSQSGGELPYFIGKQYGSGWLKTIGRLALPILKRVGLAGMRAAKEIMESKGPVLPILKQHALNELGQALPQVASAISSKIDKKRKKFRSTSRINKRLKGNGTIFET